MDKATGENNNSWAKITDCFATVLVLVLRVVLWSDLRQVQVGPGVFRGGGLLDGGQVLVSGQAGKIFRQQKQRQQPQQQRRTLPVVFRRRPVLSLGLPHRYPLYCCSRHWFLDGVSGTGAEWLSGPFSRSNRGSLLKRIVRRSTRRRHSRSCENLLSMWMCNAQSSLDTFPRSFSVHRRGSCQLVTDLLRGNGIMDFGL